MILEGEDPVVPCDVDEQRRDVGEQDTRLPYTSPMSSIDPFALFVLSVLVSVAVVLTIDGLRFRSWCCRSERRKRVREADRFVEEFFANKRREDDEDERQS